MVSLEERGRDLIVKPPSIVLSPGALRERDAIDFPVRLVDTCPAAVLHREKRGYCDHYPKQPESDVRIRANHVQIYYATAFPSIETHEFLPASVVRCCAV